MKETADLLWDTAERIRNIDTPTVMMLFGDHKPWLGDGNSGYNELGIRFQIHDVQSLMDRYATPYIIWANTAAKELLGMEFSGEGPSVSPGFLMNVLFHTLGWEGNAVMQFTDKVMDTLPVINTTGYYLEEGEFKTVLDQKGKELMQKYDEVQYYLHKHPELTSTRN